MLSPISVLRVPSKPLSRYYWDVYRLAQNATEAFTMFIVIQKWFKTGWSKDFDNAITNEDLLRIIAHSTRRTGIIALHILCDDGKQGKRGVNVFKLVRRLGEMKSIPTKPLFARLESQHETMKKVRLLRHHNDAHYEEGEDWRKGLGKGLKTGDIDNLLKAIFSVLLDCGKILDIQKLSCKSLQKATITYGERLIRALGEQVKAGKVGIQYQSVRDWEESITTV